MAQFDLHRLSDGMVVVDLQTDLIGLNATRIVAPLRDSGRYPEFPNLTPVVDFEGVRYVVQVQDLAALTPSELGPAVGTLGCARDDLLRAIDILIHGF